MGSVLKTNVSHGDTGNFPDNAPRQCAYFQCDPIYNTTIGEHDAKIASASFMYPLSFCIRQAYASACRPALPILANTHPGRLKASMGTNGVFRVFTEWQHTCID